MAKFNKENYIHVPGFAITELKLQGNELLAFSLIHGFSQDKQSEFKGSLSYITSALNCSKTTAITVLKKLCEKEIINRRENNVGGITLVFYSIKFNNIYGSKETVLPVQNLKQGGTESLRGGTESGHNNIIYTNDIIEKDNTNVLSKKKFFEQNEDCFSDDLKNEKSFQKKVAPKKSFSIPSVEEIRSYCIERQNYVDPEKFHSHYTSVGWKVGKNQMKDWKAAVRTWEKNHNNKANYNGTEQQPQQERFIGRQSQQQIIDALEREQTSSYDPRFRE